MAGRKNAPFHIYGLIYDDESGKYLRMPDPIAQSTSTAVGTLNDNTAGGRVRFRTNSGFIGIYAIMKNSPPFSYMPATGKSGFDLYRKTDDREGFVYYHSFILGMPSYAQVRNYDTFFLHCKKRRFVRQTHSLEGLQPSNFINILGNHCFSPSSLYNLIGL